MAFKLAVFLMLGSILASWGTYIYDNYRFLTTTSYKKVLTARSKCDHCEKQLKLINLIPFSLISFNEVNHLAATNQSAGNIST